MRLILIRHAHYALLDHALGGRAPHPLSPVGHAQAQKLADRLATRPITAVVTSPVQRAQETAAPIAARLSLTPSLEPAFTEIDFAGWTGRGFTDLAQDPAWHAWNYFRGTARVPAGETMLETQQRAVTAALHLATTHPDGEIAVITHADVIKVIVSHILGAPLDLIRRFEIAPASTTEIHLTATDARLLNLNHSP